MKAAAQSTRDATQVPYVEKTPLDPASPVWKDAPRRTVALMPQRMTLPWGGGTVQEVAVRAVHDGTRFALRMSWDDAAEGAVVGIRRHRDSCAVMFPALPGTEPSVLMGGPGAPVVVWQWKPDWERAQDQESFRAERYPAYADDYNPANDQLFAAVGDRPRDGPANVLVAEGFGTLTRTEDPLLECRSRRRREGWDVVFRRPLDAAFPTVVPGDVVPLNFAVWDGQNGDAGCRKNVSLQWYDFGLDGSRPVPALPTGAALAGGALAAAIAWAIRRRNNAGGGGAP